MRNKLNQASLKISKKEKQLDFNSLIKVLRPEVHIIDSSNFKELVQKLTGNSTSTTSSPSLLEPKKMVDNCTLIEPEVQRDHHPETSVGVSGSTEATSSSHESCYNALVDNEFNQVCNQICMEDIFLEDSVASQSLYHFWAYQNVESLLFDDDEINPFFNCYAQIEPEVSIYDYELSGVDFYESVFLIHGRYMYIRRLQL